MDAIALIRIHLELECIGVDARGLLSRLPCPNPDDIPRFYVARHPAGYVAYCRHDLPPRLREALGALPPECAFTERDTVERILALTGSGDGIWRGKSYIFPDTLTPDLYPDAVLLDADRHRPAWQEYDPGTRLAGRRVYAILVGDRIAATCESSRENDVSAEAWVRTTPEFRRRGYARQVTAVWAHDLQRRGKIPFYSHKWDNLASRGVAHSLGLIQYIEDVGY